MRACARDARRFSCEGERSGSAVFTGGHRGRRDRSAGGFGVQQIAASATPPPNNSSLSVLCALCVLLFELPIRFGI